MDAFDAANPVLSPNGRRVAYELWSVGEVWLAGIDTPPP
ncbi:hypothetical protein JJ691_18490 [Kutzneria sp. CA-103260]|nr:hypothetical protein JJ691_18490 [Kutzneria sp. CA-103260]